MEPSPDPSILLSLVCLLVLTLINAFYICAESAFDSLNRNKIKDLSEAGNKKAALLQKLLDEPDNYFFFIHTALILTGFLASAVSAVTFAPAVAQFLNEYGIPANTLAASVVVTLVFTLLFLILGDIFPHRLAEQNSERVAMGTVNVVLFIAKITRPLTWFMSAVVTLLLKLLGKDQYEDDGDYSEEEIMSILEAGQESGQIDESGKEMINSIFEFDDKVAYEIMTPRPDVYMIDINDPLTEYLDELLEERYSRVPVYDKDSDNIIGVLYMKDFMIEARRLGFEKVDIRPMLQKPFFVPESKKINDLFTELQLSKMHIAILIDEYGGFSGIVTMEDIIEEIMGDIDDEYDDDEAKMEQLDESTYMVDGQYYLDDLSEELGIKLDSENHETIGGLVIELIGEIPDEDETEERIIEHEGCVFKIESVKDRRIDKVKLYVLPKGEGVEEDSRHSEKNKEKSKDKDKKDK